MTAHHEATIICDICFSTWTLVASKSLRIARHLAAQDGWVRNGKRDYCSREHQEVAELEMILHDFQSSS